MHLIWTHLSSVCCIDDYLLQKLGVDVVNVPVEILALQTFS
jgi:hypothetical protein